MRKNDTKDDPPVKMHPSEYLITIDEDELFIISFCDDGVITVKPKADSFDLDEDDVKQLSKLLLKAIEDMKL